MLLFAPAGRCSGEPVPRHVHVAARARQVGECAPEDERVVSGPVDILQGPGEDAARFPAAGGAAVEYLIDGERQEQGLLEAREAPAFQAPRYPRVSDYRPVQFLPGS